MIKEPSKPIRINQLLQPPPNAIVIECPCGNHLQLDLSHVMNVAQVTVQQAEMEYQENLRYYER